MTVRMLAVLAAGLFMPFAAAGGVNPAQAKSTLIIETMVSEHALKARRKHQRRARAKPGASLIASVKAHARAAGVPVGIALAVVRHESSFNPRARGQAGEIGLMQLKCQTARGMGYRGACGGLYNVSVNLRYGMRYLRLALNRGGVGYYNAGVGAKRLPQAAKRYALQVRRKIRRS